MSEVARVPQLRFPEFNGEWRTDELINLIEISSNKFNPIQNSKNKKCIELEHLSQETGELLGHVDSKNQASTKNSFTKGQVLFGKLRPYLRKFWMSYFDGVCSSEIWVLNGKKLTNNYLFHFIQTSKFNQIANISSGSKMPRADWKYMSQVPFSHPTKSEQQKIAVFLTAVDTKIEQLSKKQALLGEYKKGLMQKIFSQEIRFKSDDGYDFPDWEEKKLEDVLFEHKQRKTNNEEVFSVSVHKGLINQIEHLGRSFSAKNTDNYNLVKPGDIVYTKSPTGSFPYGIIKQSKTSQDVIVSPLYGVFTPETSALGYMLNVFFESKINVHNYLHSIIQKGAKNTINITNNTFLSKALTLPVDKTEQAKIGSFLSSIDNKIEQASKQLEASKQFKKALLQQMFV
jgi:type I restriction enzyme S subunit